MQCFSGNKRIRAVILALIMVLCFSGTAAAATQATVTGKVVKIRSGPGTSYIQKGTLLQGARITVIGEQSGWCKIALKKGMTGWVKKEYLKLAAATAATSKTAVKAGKKVEITSKVANLRAGPGTHYTKKGQAARGQKLTLLGQINGWYKVQTSKGIAYIAPYLARLVDTPVAYAAEISIPQAPSAADTAGSGQSTASPGANTGTGTGTAADPALQPAGQGVQPANGGSGEQGGNGIAGQPADGQWQFTSPSGTDLGGSQTTQPVQPAPVPSWSPISRPCKIVLDAGHGGYDPGALGSSGSNEKSINLAIVQKLKVFLEQQGFTVRLTRSDDTYIGLYDRVAVANNEGADLFVSVHCNANDSKGIMGTQVYYYTTSGDTNAERKRSLAQTVQKNLLNYLGRPDKGVLQAGFVVIKYTQMPSILVETAFLSNPAEEALLMDQLFQERAALAIACGIREYWDSPVSQVIDPLGTPGVPVVNGSSPLPADQQGMTGTGQAVGEGTGNTGFGEQAAVQ